MKFSVLIPVYKNDRPEQITECLRSIENQTLKANEVLILVDGPVSEEIRHVINNSPFTAHYFERNRGLPFVLNEGIKLARNEHIFRMDADDIAVPLRFEKQIGFFKNNPETALLGGQIQEFLESKDQLKGKRLVPLKARDIIRFSRWRNPFNHPTVAFKKSIIEALGGYDTKAAYFEDYELWIRIIAKGYPVANLPEVLCYMRINTAFIQRRAGLNYLKSELYLLKRMKSLNFISLPQFLFLSAVRLPARLIPISLLKMIYGSILRRPNL